MKQHHGEYSGVSHSVPAMYSSCSTSVQKSTLGKMLYIIRHVIALELLLLLLPSYFSYLARVIHVPHETQVAFPLLEFLQDLAQREVGPDHLARVASSNITVCASAQAARVVTSMSNASKLELLQCRREVRSTSYAQVATTRPCY